MSGRDRTLAARDLAARERQEARRPLTIARDDTFHSHGEVSEIAWRQLEQLALSLSLRPAAPLDEVQAACRALDPADRRRAELARITFHVSS